MPIYIQPSSLTDLAVANTGVLFQSILEHHLNAQSWNNISAAGTQFLQQFSNHIDMAYGEKVKENLILQCMAAICRTMTGSDVTMYQFNRPELTEWEKEVYCYFITFIFNQGVKKFDVTLMPNPVRRLVYYCMGSLTALEKLVISRHDISFTNVSAYAQSESEFSKYLEDSLKSLNNLKTYIHKYSCTDKFVKIISECAPELKCLDVRFSSSVTWGCLSSILHLTHLKEILLNGCDINEKKLVKFFQEIPQYFECEGDLTNSLGFDNVTEKNLSIIMKSCPNLTKICFGKCSFHELKNFFRVKGNRLCEIILCNISGIDLTMIGDNSKSLKKFSMKDCTIVRKVEPTSSGFINLEKCDFIVQELEDVKGILQNCTELKVLRLTCNSTNSETPFTFRHVIIQNPFAKLRTVMLELAEETISVAYVLLERATNVEKIYLLGIWGIIDEEELVAFQNFVRNSSPGTVVSTKPNTDEDV